MSSSSFVATYADCPTVEVGRLPALRPAFSALSYSEQAHFVSRYAAMHGRQPNAHALACLAQLGHIVSFASGTRAKVTVACPDAAVRELPAYKEFLQRVDRSSGESYLLGEGKNEFALALAGYSTYSQPILGAWQSAKAGKPKAASSWDVTPSYPLCRAGLVRLQHPDHEPYLVELVPESVKVVYEAVPVFLTRQMWNMTQTTEVPDSARFYYGPRGEPLQVTACNHRGMRSRGQPDYAALSLTLERLEECNGKVEVRQRQVAIRGTFQLYLLGDDISHFVDQTRRRVGINYFQDQHYLFCNPGMSAVGACIYDYFTSTLDSLSRAAFGAFTAEASRPEVGAQFEQSLVFVGLALHAALVFVEKDHAFSQYLHQRGAGFVVNPTRAGVKLGQVFWGLVLSGQAMQRATTARALLRAALFRQLDHGGSTELRHLWHQARAHIRVLSLVSELAQEGMKQTLDTHFGQLSPAWVDRLRQRALSCQELFSAPLSSKAQLELNFCQVVSQLGLENLEAGQGLPALEAVVAQLQRQAPVTEYLGRAVLAMPCVGSDDPRAVALAELQRSPEYSLIHTSFDDSPEGRNELRRYRTKVHGVSVAPLPEGRTDFDPQSTVCTCCDYLAPSRQQLLLHCKAYSGSAFDKRLHARTLRRGQCPACREPFSSEALRSHLLEPSSACWRGVTAADRQTLAEAEAQLGTARNLYLDRQQQAQTKYEAMMAQFEKLYGSSETAPSSSVPSRPAMPVFCSADECVVCCNAFGDSGLPVVLVPCGHAVLCKDCAPRVGHCPLCRTIIQSRICC